MSTCLGLFHAWRLGMLYVYDNIFVVNGFWQYVRITGEKKEWWDIS